MGEEEFLSYTIEQLALLLQTQKLSPVEVTRASLDQIEALNPSLCAYTVVLAEQALEQAREAERALARGETRSLLHGVPVSVKDVFATKNIPTTWGARDLAEYRPTADSTVVVKLREAGAVLLGKTNVDMYPYDGGPETPRLIGPTRNPWDLERVAGRSSGGSAAAVAALLGYGSIGSDTGGSIRQPAAMCGVVGLKPTFGLVSKYGVFLYSDSFDHCGPITRTVHDCAVLLGAIAGYDPKDPVTVAAAPIDYTVSLQKPAHGLRIGLPRAEAWEGNDPEVTRLVENAVSLLSDLGMELREIDLPFFRESHWVNAVSVLETTAMAEAMLDLPTDPIMAHMMARNVAARNRALDQGLQISRAAQRAYAHVFERIDLIILPTIPTTAPRFDEDSSPWQRPEEPFPELITRYTRIFSLIRCPAITIPCGFASNGMPVGLQMAGRQHDEETVLCAAHAYERESGWNKHYLQRLQYRTILRPPLIPE